MSDNSVIHREFYKSFLGDYIAGGRDRAVYKHDHRPDLVIKVEDKSRSFQNVSEWLTWQLVQNRPEHKWFAPCEWISSCGSVLFMSRTEPIQERQLPKTLPVWLIDTKLQNYGMLNGKFVCHDYGINHVFHNDVSKRTYKPKWRIDP